MDLLTLVSLLMEQIKPVGDAPLTGSVKHAFLGFLHLHLFKLSQGQNRNTRSNLEPLRPY